MRVAELQRAGYPSRAEGPAAANEYWQFCLEHVREYNNSYNFFAGMSEDAVAKYQKDAITGHRPTWKMGSVGGERSTKRRARGSFRGADWGAEDPFSLFGETGAPALAMRGRRRRVARFSMHNAARSTRSGLRPTPSGPISRPSSRCW